jgi:hypothetical protein
MKFFGKGNEDDGFCGKVDSSCYDVCYLRFLFGPSQWCSGGTYLTFKGSPLR